MTKSEPEEQTDPELELGSLDAAEQNALAALDAAIASDAHEGPFKPANDGTDPERPPGSASDSEPAASGGRGSWPSFFPQPPERRSQFADLLTPSGVPPERSTPISAFRPVTDAQPGEGPTPLTDEWNPESPTARMPSAGLISSILGQSEGAIGDEGALAALRTLPRRSRPDHRAPYDLRDEQQIKARLELLAHLSEQSSGLAKTRLLSASAELIAREAGRERSLAAYRAAHEADPSDRLALRRLRRELLVHGLRSDAAALFRAEAALSPIAREQCLALCAAAELAVADQSSPPPAATPGGSDAPSRAALHPPAVAAIKAARMADPSSLLAGLLLAQRTRASGDRAGCAVALRASAERAGRPGTRALLWLEAARALERAHDEHASMRESGAELRTALDCYQRASSADPGAFGPWLGVQRCSIALGDPGGAARALASLADVCPDPRLAAELRRQRALLLNEPRAAFEALRTQIGARGLRALARAAEGVGEPRFPVTD